MKPPVWAWIFIWMRTNRSRKGAAQLKRVEVNPDYCDLIRLTAPERGRHN